MRWRFIWFLLILPFQTSGRPRHYTNTDNRVRIEVVWENTSGKEQIILNIIPLENILVPKNEGCFKLDTSEGSQCRFRNMYCPYYVLTESSSEFVLLRKDSIVSYTWHGPEGKEVESFAFAIEYIATNTCEYKQRGNKIILMPDAQGEEIFFIKPEDEVALRSRVHLKITP